MAGTVWRRLTGDLWTYSFDALISCAGFTTGALLFPFVYYLASSDHILFHRIMYTILYPAISAPALTLIVSCCLRIGTGTRQCDPTKNVWNGYFLGCVVGLGLLFATTFQRQYPIFWPFGFYLILLGFFHWSEFFFTALFNPDHCSLEIYMLDHSPEYLIALVASIIEYWVETLLLHFSLLPWSTPAAVRLFGLLICCSGELLRKAALLTARTNFDHFVEVSKRPEHILVTHGVYSWFRHPAYVGWFYWALGTQVLLGNPICLIGYAIASHCFFRTRIEFEEMCLLRFFGDDYVRYQNKVGVGIPFVRGYKAQRESIHHLTPQSSASS